MNKTISTLLILVISVICISQNPYEKINQDIEKSFEILFSNKPKELTLDEEKKSLLQYEDVVAKEVSYIIFISREGYFDVEENYTVVFNRNRRGIYRQLFLKYILDVEENKELDYAGSLTDADCAELYDLLR